MSILSSLNHCTRDPPWWDARPSDERRVWLGSSNVQCPQIGLFYFSQVVGVAAPKQMIQHQKGLYLELTDGTIPSFCGHL